MQKLKTENLQLQVEITVCKTFNFLLPAKTKTNKKEGRKGERKKVLSMYFLGGQRWQKWQRWWKGENGETSSLCRLRAVQTQVWGTPSQSVRSCSPGWKVGGKEQGSRTQREREWVAVKWSGTQSVSHSGQSGRQAARQCIWVQAGCAPTPRTYNPRWGGGGLCTSLLQSLWLTTRSLSHQLILGKTDRIVHWVSPLDTKSKCLWLAAVKKEGSEQDGVG